MGGRDPVNETEFLGQVTSLAELLGWNWVHFRPAKTAHGWRTPVSGTLGAGWPDLILVRARDGRLIFAELKADKGRLDDHQHWVLGVLRSAAPAHVWRPSDWETIAEVLR